MSVDTDWIAEVRTLMAATLSGCTEANTYWATQANRMDIREAIDNSKITLPIFSLDVGLGRDVVFGGDNRVTVYPITIKGLYSSKDAGAAIAGGYDITTFCLAQGGAMADALLSYSGSAFQIIDDYPVIDVGSAQPQMEEAMGLNYQLWAFTLNSGLMTGETRP